MNELLTRDPSFLREARGLIEKILDKRRYDSLEEITDLREKDEVRAEINEALKSLESKRVVKVRSDRGKPALFESILEKHKREDPSTKYRMCNTASDIQAMWRSKGFTVVKDKDGNTERDGDLILMSCPMDAFIENVRQPMREKKADRKKAITNIERQFKEEAAHLGVPTFGGIEFDQREEA